jgi:galactose mutarotase-like enzyme
MAVSRANRKIWRAVVENEALALTDNSPLAEERCPGRMTATVRYSIVGNPLRMGCSVCTPPLLTSPVNLTNRSTRCRSHYQGPRFQLLLKG